MIRMKLAYCQSDVPQLAGAIMHFLPFIRDKIPDSPPGVPPNVYIYQLLPDLAIRVR